MDKNKCGAAAKLVASLHARACVADRDANGDEEGQSGRINGCAMRTFLSFLPMVPRLCAGALAGSAGLGCCHREVTEGNVADYTDEAQGNASPGCGRKWAP